MTTDSCIAHPLAGPAPRCRIPLIVLGCLALCLSFAPARAGEAARLTGEELKGLLLPDVVIESADPRPAGGAEKAFTRVLGVIGGHIRFEVLLPDEWNGRFAMGGGGGFVGSIQNAVRGSVHQGYATAGTDTGHAAAGGVPSAQWAHNDIEAQVNFGYLAVHRTAEVAKAIIRAYYGKPPEYSYFVGCSRGGGQAMMESQRYPRDFDGIVAGAPAFNWTGFAAYMVRVAQVLYPDPQRLDHGVLTLEALQSLGDEIIRQCDEQDGVKDGVINDPGSVRFDLSRVEGLTEAQRRAIQAIFDGVRNERGAIYPGYPVGAEVVPGPFFAWLTGPAPQLLRQGNAPSLTFAFGTEVYKYLVFNDPDWDYTKYDFSTFERDTRMAASFLNATNADLSGLKARNGKLIIYHGWADTALPAQATIDYYKRVLKHDPKAADYCRLFMIPGCLHCGGGPGATSVDWLGAIVDWVEHGRAPDRLIGSKIEGGKVVMTRPLYPYPQKARYKGQGDTDNAESFDAVEVDCCD